MKIYIIPTGNGYQFYTSEKKNTIKLKLDRLIQKIPESKIKPIQEEDVEEKKLLKRYFKTCKRKMRPLAQKYARMMKPALKFCVNKMETGEELALKMAYSSEDLKVGYSPNISEEEARRGCTNMSRTYLRKNVIPMVLYGIFCPPTFVIAPFIPVLNWGVTAFLAYKFSSKYRCIRGYKKMLRSEFEKIRYQDLESIVKNS